MMKWKKLGKVFCPRGEFDWMHSHAAVPIAEHIEGDIFRIYFSARDFAGRSHTGFVIIDLMRPNEILELSSSPVLSPGSIGEFDDSGAMATWLVKTENERLMYYIGWNLGVTVPFRNSIGLAIGGATHNFSRYAPGPIIDRSMREPHFCASCCVLPGEDYWRMWYLSCTGWSGTNDGLRHHYHIKYAESDEGIYWRREGIVAIDFSDINEYAISRPSVIRDHDSWRMWYSFRGNSYRIGFADSDNGKNWNRRDDLVGLDVSTSGWDSEMIEYPFVFDHKGERFMLYNGNGYGKTGFGLAVLEQS
jgi:hypothetical protein